tara:strand:+ start:247 stop:381 length:135 start_codon:yes stop_codon:yes gene_type:complete
MKLKMNKKIIYLILFTTLIVFIRGATEIKVGRKLDKKGLRSCSI